MHYIYYCITNRYINIKDIINIKNNNKSNVKDNIDYINNWRNILLSHGIGLNNIKKALDIVINAVDNIIKDTIGLWALGYDKDYNRLDFSHSAAEQEFYYKSNKYIIDRLFLDNNTNILWVIDYKISINLDNSLDKSIEQYTKQLNIYKSIVSKFYNKIIKTNNIKVKTALYYPLDQKLVETSSLERRTVPG